MLRRVRTGQLGRVFSFLFPPPELQYRKPEGSRLKPEMSGLTVGEFRLKPEEPGLKPEESNRTVEKLRLKPEESGLEPEEFMETRFRKMRQEKGVN